MILVDPNRLRMVLENIIDNAMNYSLPNKTIKVAVRSSAETVKISVQDQGVGIDKNDFPKLFQKFSRIPNPLSVEVGGSGLGLYWAHKIVLLHNGTIEVKSTIGHGSTFTVILPKTGNEKTNKDF
jgi:signal transduction histidine kinase